VVRARVTTRNHWIARRHDSSHRRRWIGYAPWGRIAVAMVVSTILVSSEVLSSPAEPDAAATFSMSPQSGPVGTTVDLHSVTPCVAPPGGTNWRVSGTFVYNDGDLSPILAFSAPVGPNGGWSASFTPNLNATGPGVVQVNCQDTQGDSLDYSSQSFNVTTSGHGYWLLSNDLGACPVACFDSSPTPDPVNVASFGDANFYGPEPAPTWAAPLVGIAADAPTGTGYWLVGADGGVASYSAPFYGSLPSLGIATRNVIGIAATANGRGYWLGGADGGIFAFGDAAYFGSLPGSGIHTSNIVGVAATPDGGGYWIVGRDGGVFAFGDAGYFGSLPGLGIHLSNIVGMAATPSGGGYWIVASDGGVFAFGDAPFFGSLPEQHLAPAKPIVGVAASADGGGYWMVGADGGIFSFGDARFYGSCAGKCTTTSDQAAQGFVGIVSTPVTPSL
jgi:hypothetical protein